MERRCRIGEAERIGTMSNKEPESEAVAFCDECIAAFAEMKPTKGVGLFVQFAACAYAALKRLEKSNAGDRAPGQQLLVIEKRNSQEVK